MAQETSNRYRPQKGTIVFVLFVIAITFTTAIAQETKRPEAEGEKPKNEVDRMLEDAAKRGEPIIATCVTPDCTNSTDIPAGLERGRMLQISLPGYPPIARAAHVEGEVQVDIIISEEGKVIAAAAISGHPLLQAASVAAARNATFTPALLHGKPAKVRGVIKYKFHLADNLVSY